MVRDGPSGDATVSDALAQVLGGDPHAVALLVPIPHAELRGATASLAAPLGVSRAAVVSVLRGLRLGTILPAQAHGWASFVRRGYIATPGAGPVRPLDIAYEAAWEEAIAAAIFRLDQIGDAVDGDVTVSEVLDLLQLLGEP